MKSQKHFFRWIVKGALNLSPQVSLCLLFIFGLFLRFYQLQDGLIFGYDQARDAYRAQSIVKDGNLKLLGPETDIPGLHHGAGYYYLLAIPYGVSADPSLAAFYFAFLNGLGIFLVYWGNLVLFKHKSIALLSSALYIVSFEIVQYGRWLSNPSLALLTTLVAFVGLWIWIEGKQGGFLLSLAAIAAGLHFQFFLVYLYVMPLVVFLLYRPRLTPQRFLTGILIALLIDSPLLYAEFKFNFQGLKALWYFFNNQISLHSSLFDFLLRYLERYLDRLNSVLFHTLFPLHQAGVWTLLALLLLVLYFRRHQLSLRSPEVFLIIWVLSSFPLFIFSSGALTNEFSLVGIVSALVFLDSYLIYHLLQKKRLRVIGIILLVSLYSANIRFNLIHAYDGAYIFSVQKIMTYGLEKQVIDYTYAEANGEPFTICTLTNPLFINTTWAYLYETYGKEKYHYIPFWSGADQDSYLGGLPADTQKVRLRFHIYEPLIGQPFHSVEVFSKLEDYISDVVDERILSDFRVQKRLLLSDVEMDIRNKQLGPINYARFFNPTTLLYRCYK